MEDPLSSDIPAILQSMQERQQHMVLDKIPLQVPYHRSGHLMFGEQVENFQTTVPSSLEDSELLPWFVDESA